jgi:hypothetical protein
MGLGASESGWYFLDKSKKNDQLTVNGIKKGSHCGLPFFLHHAPMFLEQNRLVTYH